MDRIQAVFPDFRNHLEEIISEDDRAFAQLTYRRTHHGTVFGIPPMGRRMEYVGTAVSRFRGEKIAAVWVLGDVHGLLQQLRESASYIVKLYCYWTFGSGGSRLQTFPRPMGATEPVPRLPADDTTILAALAPWSRPGQASGHGPACESEFR
jgi:hypothetical protein